MNGFGVYKPVAEIDDSLRVLDLVRGGDGGGGGESDPLDGGCLVFGSVRADSLERGSDPPTGVPSEPGGSVTAFLDFLRLTATFNLAINLKTNARVLTDLGQGNIHGSTKYLEYEYLSATLSLREGRQTPQMSPALTSLFASWRSFWFS